eukprot:1730330-Pleurochrysis_carterae.AAC.2
MQYHVSYTQPKRALNKLRSDARTAWNRIAWRVQSHAQTARRGCTPARVTNGAHAWRVRSSADGRRAAEVGASHATAAMSPSPPALSRRGRSPSTMRARLVKLHLCDYYWQRSKSSTESADHCGCQSKDLLHLVEAQTAAFAVAARECPIVNEDVQLVVEANPFLVKSAQEACAVWQHVIVVKTYVCHLVDEGVSCIAAKRQ